MTEKETQKGSSRTFTKRVAILNMAAVWLLMFSSVIFQQAEHVITGGFALIGTLFGIYTGIGHLDYRKAAEISIDRLINGDREK